MVTLGEFSSFYTYMVVQLVNILGLQNTLPVAQALN